MENHSKLDIIPEVFQSLLKEASDAGKEKGAPPSSKRKVVERKAQKYGAAELSKVVVSLKEAWASAANRDIRPRTADIVFVDFGPAGQVIQWKTTDLEELGMHLRQKPGMFPIAQRCAIPNV